MTPGIAKFGRVTVDDRGIRQRRALWLFGRRFDLPWAEITRWAWAEAVMPSKATGKKRVIARILELHHAGGVEQVCWTGSARRFESLVRHVHERLPKKQARSTLAKLRPDMYRQSNESTPP